MRFRVALAQVSSLLGNVERNLEKQLSYIAKARDSGADFLIFPELSLTGYLLRDLAYEVADDCRKALEALSKVASGIYIITGFVQEPRLGLYRNAAALIGDGTVLGVIPKCYLPTYGLFEEKRYFKEGMADDVRIFDTKFGKVGTVICEDVWHPEPCEALARMGADVIFCIAASPIRGFYSSEGGKTPVERSWEMLLAARAIENSVFMIFVNKAGAEDEEYFWGGSSIVSPEGLTIAKANDLQEDFILGEIDLSTLKRVRRFSSFRDHHGDLHELLRGL